VSGRGHHPIARLQPSLYSDCHAKGNILNLGETFFRSPGSTRKDELDKAPALPPYPPEERVRVEGAGAGCEARMRTRNDYALGVVWAALIGLLVVTLWFKVPLG
jgi:hypothetical protein